MASERLQKIIAQAGISSRRAAEQLIVDGRVRVNGRIIRELGCKADLARDNVQVEGQGTLRREAAVYILAYKPAHVVSTVEDPEGRPTVVQLLQHSRAVGPRSMEGGLPRVYPVGRLDWDAEGLILLTNDGALTHALLHPQHHVPKTYMVKVRGRPSEAALGRLRRGLRLRNDDGTWSSPTAAAGAQVVKEGKTNTWMELTLFEGRNHQVKRMCDAINHVTVRLIRVSFGGLELGTMESGQWRFLTAMEVASLKGWSQPERRVGSRVANRA